MLIRLKRIWDRLQGSLWFVPLAIVAAYFALSFGMVALDRALGDEVTKRLPVLFEAGPEGTRDMLSTIAGSILSVAAVAFSFTIVVFSFASSQYASRTIHSFMDDNTNQIVLGMLLGTFVYCLLILRTVRLESDNPFVPLLSTSVALVLAIVDLALFVLFIHHISESIQAYHIIRRVGSQTRKAIESLYPTHVHSALTEEEVGVLVDERNTVEVESRTDGYIQAVDTDYLMHMAERSDLLIVMHKGVGRFVVKGEALSLVGPAARVTQSVRRAVHSCFSLGHHRTILQDPQYGLLQLSDIAIKALSPAINDPNTAVMSLNEISSVLRTLAGRDIPRHVLCGSEGKPRLVTLGPTFESMVSQAFDQIRRYGMADATVAAKMLDVIAEVAERTDLQEQRVALIEHVLAIREDADRKLLSMRDRLYLNERLAPAAAALGIEAAVPPIAPISPSEQAHHAPAGAAT
ncbi:MAG TPA: DUF2254 domain-containing protein [Chloroflexia bacterium]|nr:DUF2254 domain-containing protein [Chloroflexia bacterium]